MVDEISLDNLTLNSDKDYTFQSVRDVLLSSNVKAVRKVLSSGPSGVLIIGADRETRRAIITDAIPGVEIISVCTYVIGKPVPEEELLEHEMICFDDVDFPEATIEAFIKGLFPATTFRNRTIVGLASTDSTVATTLRRAGRFEVLHHVKAPCAEARRSAWTYILHMVFVIDNKFMYPKTAAEDLAAISPGYGLHDFTQIVHRFMGCAMTLNKTHEFKIDSTYEQLKTCILEHRPMQSSSILPFITTSSESVAATLPVPGDEGIWGEHAGYESTKQQLERLAKWPVLHAETFKRLGVRAPRGVLLYGPHGCGKTMLAAAFVRRLVHANWVWVAGNDLFCKFLGESEARVRALFARARELSPCVVVIDDLDVVAAARDPSAEALSGSSGVEHRVLAALLTELDGVQGGEVFVLACASRADCLDAALVRPGRLDHMIEIGTPELKDRLAILRKLLKKVRVEGGDDGKRTVIGHLGRVTSRMTGADIDGVCREAGMLALEEMENCQFVQMKHFDRALREYMEKSEP